MSGASEADPDLLRKIALILEPLQRSPPEPVVLGLATLAADLGCSVGEAADALDRLADLSLIEGPGTFYDSWLFRRLTPKGLFFVDEVRNETRWRQIKNAYSRKAV